MHVEELLLKILLLWSLIWVMQGKIVKLLRELQNTSDRSARFVCAVAIVNGEKETEYRGSCEGRIASQPSGKEGFGYDPVFVPQAHPQKSMAELSMEEKNKISHRGNAFVHLLDKINSVL